jgi:aspartate aminotransferase-like enzyme
LGDQLADDGEPEATAAAVPVARMLQPGDHVLVMSNGGFGNVHQKILDRLAAAGKRANA